jgi:hypothetical protein
MTNSTREAFEQWYGHPDRVPHADPPFPWKTHKELCFAAWQASRSHALEEAAKACDRSAKHVDAEFEASKEQK